MRRIRFGMAFVLTTVLLLAGVAGAQQLQRGQLPCTHIQGNVHVIPAAGGNIAVAVGVDGAMLIDSGYEQMADKVRDAVQRVCPRPIRYVVNTHWHFDHVGGNAALGAGEAIIIAHDNVRKRMSSEQYLATIDAKMPPSPAEALPDVTFAESMTWHLGNEDVCLIHLEPAHTDGDTLVVFERSNVIHTGDVFFNGTYPYIDVNAGGSIDGMVKAVDKVLELANDQTAIIPGHGPLSDVARLREYRAMLATVRDKVRVLLTQGKTRDEVIAAKPTAELDEAWARAFTPEQWVTMVYDGMVRTGVPGRDKPKPSEDQPRS